jgi:pre-mRNA 3'-end-processing factor FIP1
MSVGDDDAWLYGDEDSKGGTVEPPGEALPAIVTEAGDGAAGGAEQIQQEVSNEGESVKPQVDNAPNIEDNDAAGEEMTVEGDEENVPPIDEDEDDDSDDDIEITIDKDKIEAAKTSYQNMQMTKASQVFAKEKKGKFAVEEFDQVGTINSESAVEFDMESLDDKPWRKPGADITDYFNYGFTEDTWTAYCNRQKTLRGNEAGVPVLPSAPILSVNKVNKVVTPSNNFNMSNITILGGGEFVAAAKNAPRIVSTLKPVEPSSSEPSGISVMTHDKRIYSSKTLSNMDFSVPPPLCGFSMPPPGLSS